ncbi:hypothetical protein SK128_002437 [Halocaridina rubra]|uniref:C3H1-type domain-containing protein n=1 Tax=Halocaridina rubra TaxID=373956 RepID=A0AAN8XFV7_HALRR
MGMDEDHSTGIEYMRWTLLSITIPNQSKVVPGCNSQERKIQAARESSTIPAFFHPSMKLPDTPQEPDPEMVTRVEPKEIPLLDVTGQDTLHDHRHKMWPEPMYGEPPVNFGYPGMGSGPPPHPPPTGNDGGSHWVVGGPPAGGFPGPSGPPIYNGPGGYGGPGMGGPGMGGPGNYGGDMGGGMDVPQGWGGPPPGPGPLPGPGMGPGPGMPYPNQDMMMGGNNHGMMMGGGGGGGGRHGGPPRGMMHNMGMGGGGGQNFRGGRGGPGGNWGTGPRTVCKHHLNGHCRHGKNCRFLHSRH